MNWEITQPLTRFRITRVLAGLTMALGIVVILGWQFDLPALKSIIPGYITMKFNTAVGLMLLASAIWVVPLHRRMGLALAYGAALIGVLTLIEYLAGANLGIDELCFLDLAGVGKAYPPGRLAPITALIFCLFGLGIYCANRNGRRHYATAQGLYLVCAILSFQALVAYCLGVQTSFGVASHTRIAIHTALAVIFLCIGSLLQTGEEGFMRLLLAKSAGGATARKLIFAALFVPPGVNGLDVLAQRAGYYDADFGTLLRLIGNMAFFVVMVWRNSENLHRAEIERERANAKLQAQEHARIQSEADRHAADEIEKSEARLRAIFESAFDGIVGMDAVGGITHWNTQAEKIFGWTRLEVLGRHLMEVTIPAQFHVAIREDLRAFFSSAQGANQSRSLELQAHRRSGEVFPIRLSVHAIQVGEQRQFTAFVEDISERKRNEQELIATRQQALDAVKAKAEFLANMSHEIRTPLNGIVGMTDLLLDSELDEQQRRHARIVQESGNLLLTVVNDILDFSKIEAGKLALETIDFSPVQLIENQADLLMNQARQKGLALMTYIEPDVPSALRGDPGRLGQVLLNLMSNALKFTVQGSVVVRVGRLAEPGRDGATVGGHPVGDGFARLRISVTDSGIGLAEEAQRRLFQPFTQADGSTARRFGGTGLGLSISKKLVELMGGQIGLESQLGAGSTFWFTVDCPIAAGAGAVPDHSVRGLAGRTAMIVDDDPQAIEVIEGYLRSWGMRTESFTEPLEALARLEDRSIRFDVMTIDQRMPELDGPALARLIHQANPDCVTPKILLTAYDLTGATAAAQTAGRFFSTLTKPLKKAALQAAMLEAILGVKMPEAAAESRSVSVTPGELGRILVAEDNSVNQLLMLTMLRKMGYTCQAVANGKEALTAVQSGAFDLVLMDCQMPEMDGFEATRQIRALEAAGGKRIPIVALTANAMPEDVKLCLDCGMDAHLAKPVRREIIARALQAFLRPVAGSSRAA